MQRSRVTCRAAAVSALGLLWVVTAAFACPETCDCGSDGEVDCRRRGLTVVPANIPLGTTVLNLWGNNIQNLSDADFSYLTSLEKLYLYYNDIRALPVGVFSHLTSLQELWLFGNHIADLPDGVFSHLTSLEGLFLHNNSIWSLPTGVFSHLTSLQGLTLSGNHIADLPDGVFSHLTSLEWLDLSNNNISSLPTGVFSHLTRLDELNLDNNNISSLPTGVFSHLISLQFLYIAGNPLRCDCSLYGLMTSARLRALIEDDPTCSSPPHMKSYELFSVTGDKVCQSRGDCTTGSADGTCDCNVGWTGPFCGKEDNLALRKEASQSSTRGNGTGAEKAVDGSTKNCAVTNLEHEPWWKLDLAGYYAVSRVSISVTILVPETIFMVRVGPNENFTQNDQCGQIYTGEVWDTVALCNPPMYGRYVSIQAARPSIDANTTILVLCEVEVYVTGACCNKTISITNGQITASNGYCSGNRIQFSCDTWYELVGSSFAFCRENHWDREIPTCQLSATIIGGASVGIATALIVAAVFFVVFLRRRRKKRREGYQQPIELSYHVGSE